MRRLGTTLGQEAPGRARGCAPTERDDDSDDRGDQDDSQSDRDRDSDNDDNSGQLWRTLLAACPRRLRGRRRGS